MLFGSTIVNCSREETFGDVISRLQEEWFSERSVEKVSIEDNKHRHEVQPSCVQKIFGHVSFFLPATWVYFFIKVARATKHQVGLASENTDHEGMKSLANV